MRDAVVNLSTLQFALYAVLCFLAFAAWTELVVPSFVNGYVNAHLQRWTVKLPVWGPIILAAGLLSLTATYFLSRSKRLGGYLGMASFLIGLGVNVYVARNLMVHCLIGALIGWILLVPLFISWGSLRP